MNKKNLFSIFLFIVTAIYYLPIINLPLAPYDEAVILVGAERVLHGQMPYKDFLTLYGPGQVYTLAAVFKAFGISVTSERVYDILIKSLLSLLIFLIIRQFSSNKMATIGWVMSLIWIDYSRFHAYPVYPSVLFIFLCIYFLLLHMKHEKLYYVVFSAVSIVLAVLFRHDLGGLAAIAIALVLLLQKLTGAQQSWITLISYITAGIISGLPVILYFVLADADAVINDLIVIPIDTLANQQGLPYPSLSRYNLPFYVFPFIPLIGVITFLSLLKRKMDNTTAYGILLISVVGIVFFNQAWARSDTIHLLPIALTGILLSPILFHTLSRMLSLNARIYGLLFGLFIIFSAVTLSKPINGKIISLYRNYTVEIVNPDIERAKYVFISQDIKEVVSYIRKNTSKNEYIYVGVKNHDQFVFNDAIIYFLAERNCATKYHELNPGHTTTLKIQKEIVNELINKPAKLVVLATRLRHEPNQSSIDTHIDVLDDYISNNYELIKIYGIYEIWMKNDKHSLDKQD